MLVVTSGFPRSRHSELDVIAMEDLGDDRQKGLITRHDL
jgi:hypothetical protein